MAESTIYDEEVVELTTSRTSVSLEFMGQNIEPYIPQYATPGSSGVDLKADIKEPMHIKPGEVYLIPTGIRIAMPEFLEAQVRARSGLAAKHGAFVVNGVGTIDSDYRGEIMVILSTIKQFIINPGERIAQMVFARVEKVNFDIEVLDDTSRGSGGFGSTGI